ncbi:alpha-tubulin N-acetyltransferase 1 [Acyrthosiphon pisum]|uniref:Alpha-tubulin N-acetyltransferase n=1 Tax=Acyrthosiphon pisum TaxID=7029 RepID=A0A8R2JTV3_ACYPI|nr:alpha-tubulin N-acetyltransferase 1 [Acyrthosiphon pisum]|eukprot:XP_016663138.1 PREDICTED: alpha-tubulin N-acetyltransferase 1 [Acyrthosiphon pisum]
MEFNFNIGKVATDEVLKINNTLTVEGHEENDDLKNIMRLIIDEMGKASAVSQEFKVPITSANRLVNSDHVIYMMTEHKKPGHFAVVGFLKMGWKKLFLYDKQASRSEARVYCLLDFYIHESKQRKGYGIRLIQCMLQDIGLEAKHLAIDKPTDKLLQFMWKHFQLSKLVNQENNFVIFEEFFHNSSIAEKKNNRDNTGNRAVAYKSQPMFGRHGAHKHHDSMAEIIQGEGNAAFVKFKYNQDTDFVDNQFKEKNPNPESKGAFKTNMDGYSVKRDLKFHHNSLW